MKEYIELLAFPVRNKQNSTMSPIIAIIQHLSDEEDSDISLIFVKQYGALKCFLCVEEKYVDNALTVLSSFDIIAECYNDYDWLSSMQSRIIIHRKAVKDIRNKSVEFLNITSIINSPTINYIFSNAIDGDGLVLFLGKHRDNLAQNPVKLCTESKTIYSVNDNGLFDEFLNNSKLYYAAAFPIGTHKTQLAIAQEIALILSGWYYSRIESDTSVNELCQELLLNKYAPDVIYHNKSLVPILRLVTENEFYNISSLFSLLTSNELIQPNLNSLWDIDASRFFKETDNSICIGSSLYDEHEYYLSRNKLRQGLLIVGSPGSGKGNQLFRIIEQLKDVPMLVFESAKQEMHHLRRKDEEEKDGLSDLQTWRPIAGQFLFNPFEIPEGLTLSEYRASLIQMLRTCFRLDGPLEELFISTLNRCFYKANYTDSSTSGDSSVKKWGMHEFIIEYSKMIKSSGYSEKTKDDMRQAGLTRLKALLDSNPDVYDTNHSIHITDLLYGHNLIQLNSLPTIDAKQSLATMLLIVLGTYLQLQFKHCENQDELKLVIIMDESHNLLKSVNDINGVSYSFADDFANLMLTLRSVGVGFIISDQTTSNIPQVITNTCDSKMFMGSSKFSGIADYLDFLGADEELLKQLYKLPKGAGVFSISNSPHCILFRTPNYIDTFPLSEDGIIVNNYMCQPEYQKAATFSECQICPDHLENTICCIQSKQKARQIAQQLLLQYGNPFLWDYSFYNLKENGKTTEFKSLQRSRQLILIAKVFKKRISADISFCALIQWLRACNLEYNTMITDNEIRLILESYGLQRE